MRLFRISVWILVIYALSHDVRASDWTCRSQAALSRGQDTLLACGIGESGYESEARAMAYEQALREFKTTCTASSDCRDNKVVVRPLRTECKKTSNGHKCYRAVQFVITPQTRDLDYELEKQQQRLAEIRAEKAKLGEIEFTALALKFEQPNPSYWSLGLGVFVGGTEFGVENSLQVGYGMNFKRCFKDIFCPTIGITLGKIVLDTGADNGRFFNVYSGASIYLYKKLYAVGTFGFESQWNSEGSAVGPATTLGLGVDAIRVMNFSISVEGAVKGGPGTQVNGTFNVFGNFKF